MVSTPVTEALRKIKRVKEYDGTILMFYHGERGFSWSDPNKYIPQLDDPKFREELMVELQKDHSIEKIYFSEPDMYDGWNLVIYLR